MPLSISLQCRPLVLKYFNEQGRLIERTEEPAYTMGDPISVNQPNAEPEYDVRLLDGHTHYRHVPGPGIRDTITIRWFLGQAGTIEHLWDHVQGPVAYCTLVLVFNFYQHIDRPVMGSATYADRVPDRTLLDVTSRHGLTQMGEILIRQEAGSPWELMA